ncbi:MAG: bifunctional 5,10-methylenetetrahydrofolate dehydrogenase/5,10-methenyltetrahydrofolate cyclohydrolase [Rhodospirillales bacterium]|nr:bifunctional 5,10-methylenetetrahydrofolate dehydrogenase/5,10-methenyltetrahydrofolate cyclohydrolase [Rhodospirillales bacterium]
MTAKIIDGKLMAQELREQLAQKVAHLPTAPHLAVILVGNDEASIIYDRNKKKAAEAIGMQCTIHHLDENTTQEELLQLIHQLNIDSAVNGIIVQMPLPKHLNSEQIIESIDHAKDVDGFGIYNIGLLHSNDSSAMVAATPQAVLYMLQQTLGNIAGKHAVIIGRSNIVGRPLASLLLNNRCTVTIAHSKTVNLPQIAASADILVSACGVAKLVKKEWIKPGATVIDVGINRIDGKLCGDVDFDEAKEIAEHITPVPGGVGPMTVTMLLNNTLRAYIEQNSSLKK